MPNESTAVVPLTQGKVATIDAEDADRVLGYKWFAHAFRYKERTVWYAEKRDGYRHIPLHRFILGDACDGDIDHIDGDGMNCTKRNLRCATRAQNRANATLPRNNTSGFKGVYWEKRFQKWHAMIGVGGKKIGLGRYECPREAAQAYDKACHKHFGEFCRPNFK